MRILMAVPASVVLEVIKRFSSGGQMAFRARCSRMLAEQRIRGILMPRHGVERRLETIFTVAARAILFWKLPLVRIRRMAVRAQRMGHGFFEIAVFVAPVAIHFGVRTVKRKLGAVVVEAG